MPRASVLHWIEGRGWLVIAPGIQASHEIRARAINRAAADGALVCALVSGHSPSSDALLEDFEELGARSGYLVDLVTEDDETIEARLSEASIIVIQGGSDISSIRSALLGAAERGMRAAYERGALILAEGLSALLVGKWVMREDHVPVSGLDWLFGSIIIPVTAGLAELAKPVLTQQSGSYAVGISQGTALVLGPDGEVELWGDQQVAIALGTEYGHALDG
jgi:hypothetical protein